MTSLHYHRYRLQQQLVPLAFDRPSGGQLAPGGGSNRFQCVSIETGLNHHPVPNEGGAIGQELGPKEPVGALTWCY